MFNRLKEKIIDIMDLASSLLKGSQLDQPALEVFDIRAVMKELYERFEDLTLDGDIQVDLRLSDGQILVKGVRGDLLDAVENVMANANKALQGEGRIELVCELARDLQSESDEKNWAVIQVIDDGCGIPDDEIDRVFDRDFSKFEGGSGFGLTFAKYVVENHGGEIEIESKANKYTIITIRIPVYDGKT